jgi:regulatory protein
MPRKPRRKKPRPPTKRMNDEYDLVTEMRRAALNWLARRDYARYELASRLYRRFGDDAPVEALLEWLEECNFLNESRFAEAFVRSRIGRGQGELRIRHELEQRGVAGALIEQALVDAECDWFELAREVHQRRFNHGPGDDRKEKGRQLRFLQQRGFSAEQSYRAIEAAPAPP